MNGGGHPFYRSLSAIAELLVFINVAYLQQNLITKYINHIIQKNETIAIREYGAVMFSVAALSVSVCL